MRLLWRKKPYEPAGLSEGVTDDRADPRLGHAIDDEEAEPAEAYLVLPAEQRDGEFVNQLCLSYEHEVCGGVTQMHRAIAETWAKDPHFYAATYCVRCRMHRPVNEFYWADGGGRLGS